MLEKEKKQEGFIPLHGGYRNQPPLPPPKGGMPVHKRVAKQRAISPLWGVGGAEIKLTNVARASLEELLLDYCDFLRTRKLIIWEKDHRLVTRLRELNRTPNANYETFRKAIENPEPEICANTMLTLIKITTYLLAQQLKALETAFLNEGGLREKMFKARNVQRNKKQ